MKIKKILVSQPAPAIAEKSPYHEIVLKHHVDVKFHPFIKQEGVSLKEFRSQRVEILAHTAVIFTSRTTIDNFFRICEQARITIPEGMKYFCNTEAVALYLQKYIVYRKRKIFFADGTFSSLVELIAKHKEEKFLLTLSEPHKPELPLALEKMKLQFGKVILARTVSADLEGIDVSDYDLLVFYSPSEIASLVGNFPRPNGSPRIATFGHGTAKAAIAEGLSVSVMAPTPEIPSMTKAIDVYIHKLASGEEIAPVTLQDESPDLAFIQSQTSKSRKARPAAAKPAAARNTAADAKTGATAARKSAPKSAPAAGAAKK